MLSAPYQRRPIRFLELWRADQWQLKVYGIAHLRPSPRPELIAAAKSAALERLSSLPAGLAHYSIGFLGIHEGRASNFVFLDWWSDENELHHHLYLSPSEAPRNLADVTGTGLVACVWDLRLIGFERQAWLEAVLQNPGPPDFERYLQARLNEDV